MKILYVEDDPAAQEYITRGLTEHGYAVEVASDGPSGLERALGGVHDVLVIDVMLPRMDGFELLRRVRERGVRTPALFLSARGEVGDRVKGLDLGADDYLKKPFAFSELLARIRAITRRGSAWGLDEVRRVGDLELDPRRRTVRRGGRPIELTQREFALLEYLVENAGYPLSRSMIIDKIWGHDFDVYSNVIDVHINHLRRKVDRDSPQKLIHTVKGVGYVVEERGGETTDG